MVKSIYLKTILTFEITKYIYTIKSINEKLEKWWGGGGVLCHLASHFFGQGEFMANISSKAEGSTMLIRPSEANRKYREEE